jgi:hypothetical protein
VVVILMLGLVACGGSKSVPLTAPERACVAQLDGQQEASWVKAQGPLNLLTAATRSEVKAVAVGAKMEKQTWPKLSSAAQDRKISYCVAHPNDPFGPLPKAQS